MPNWVDNTLAVTGDKDEVRAFVEQAARSYTRKYQQYDADSGEMKWVEETLEPRLSFWNFVKPDDLESYENNWYDWNLNNWGCKWDTGEVDIEDTSLESGHISYSFSTPWGPPDAFFYKIVQDFPTLSFELRYTEEQGWGGEIAGSGGTHWVIEEWEIPNSHEDCVTYNGWCTCEGMNENETEYMHDDCPKKISAKANKVHEEV